MSIPSPSSTAFWRVFKIRARLRCTVKPSGYEADTSPMYLSRSISTPVSRCSRIFSCISVGDGNPSHALESHWRSSGTNDLLFSNASVSISQIHCKCPSTSFFPSEPSSTKRSIYCWSVGFCWLMALYIRGCVNAGWSISLWPWRR